MIHQHFTSGLPGLDRIVGGFLPGDNVVWQVDDLGDFLPLVPYFKKGAEEAGKKLIYFRFGRHQAFLGPQEGIEIHPFNPNDGFENFLFEVHRVMENSERGSYYLFDCLSDLVQVWFSDHTLANFFLLTCPFLFDLETLTYFPMFRNRHSPTASIPITDTTQIFIDVHRYQGDLYIRPIKVQHRHSTTMHMLHWWKGENFTPVSGSIPIAEILSTVPKLEIVAGGEHRDVWSRIFYEAEKAKQRQEEGKGSREECEQYLEKLIRMAITRDERIFKLCLKYFNIHDVLEIGRRMIGTGLIGGKAVGMLLARSILNSHIPHWKQIRELHDSFYIASDVFYTFLVRNGCWWVRESQRNPDTFLKGAQEARRQILRGTFPDYIVNQFSDMLDYYGQSPIIVRSSSLLEDNYGNAFAGKYDSVFLANQGPRGKRLEDFLSAVRAIYASSMSDRALRYRAQRNLLDRDEQMALLVQRVSGAQYGNLYFPQIAGVAFSYNPYRWSPEIDPEAGVVRLVFGLGTRAVDRSDDDYTRIVALNAPDRKPEDSFSKNSRCSQSKVDVLGLAANQLASMEFSEVIQQCPDMDLSLFASRDMEAERSARERGVKASQNLILTFDGLLKKTSFVKDIQEILKTLGEVYEYPVDVEFSANFLPDQSYRFNLLQCRPLQVRGGGIIDEPPRDLDESSILFKSLGAIIGPSRIDTLNRIVYVVPEIYGELPIRDRHTVARMIGRINRTYFGFDPPVTLLMGPGRWGTTTPSLGVPVSFAEINTASYLCEIVTMRDDLVPDVSLGTHFFSDLVETDMLYLALFPGKAKNMLNMDLLKDLSSDTGILVPDAPEWIKNTIRVWNLENLPDGKVVRIHANVLKQTAICYLDHPKPNPGK